jgi:flagellin-like protein
MEKRGVSAVVATILLIALTVVSVGFIYVFMAGLILPAPPINTLLEVRADAGSDTILILHKGGDPIPRAVSYYSMANLDVRVNGKSVLALEVNGGPVKPGSSPDISVGGTIRTAITGKGSGSPEDPWIIMDVGELQAISSNPSGHYALGRDIDATGYSFTPIRNFTGTFDGRGYSIRNIYINPPYYPPYYDYIGVFGNIMSGSIIKNVVVENCWMRGHYYVGGLVGYNDNGRVLGSYVTGSLNGGSGNLYIGGVVGYNNSGMIANSRTDVSLNGNQDIGGIAGYCAGGTVENSNAAGSIVSSYDTGGLVGTLNGGIVRRSCASARVSINQTRAGGLVGGVWNGGQIENSYARGDVGGGNVSYVGGLIGLLSNGTVVSSYSTGRVEGGYGSGGLVGYASGTVSNSFWDIQTSGRSSSAGGTGKTTENMKNVRTFTDNTWSTGLTFPWDFVGNPYQDRENYDIWGISPDVNDGYPYLTVIPDFPQFSAERPRLKSGDNIVVVYRPANQILVQYVVV